LVLEKILVFLGASLCHQDIARSFSSNGSYMPVCSRCTGIYIAFLASLITLVLTDRRVKVRFTSNRMLFAILFFLLVMGADVVLSALGVYQSSNLIRFFTGFMFGWFLPLVIVPLRNSLLFRANKGFSYLSQKPKFLAWVGLAIALMLIFYFTRSFLFMPWSVLSVLGELTFVSNIILILFFSICSACYGRLRRGYRQAGVYMLSGIAAAALLSGASALRLALF